MYRISPDRRIPIRIDILIHPYATPFVQIFSLKNFTEINTPHSVPPNCFSLHGNIMLGCCIQHFVSSMYFKLPYKITVSQNFINKSTSLHTYLILHPGLFFPHMFYQQFIKRKICPVINLPTTIGAKINGG